MLCAPARAVLPGTTNTPIFLDRWGVVGEGERFLLPWDIATGGADHVYVSDLNKAAIEEFASDGSFIREVDLASGTANTTPDVFSVDDSGLIYAAYEHDTQWQVDQFSSVGTLQNAWIALGGRPIAIDTDTNGDVLVLEQNVIQRIVPSDDTQSTLWTLVTPDEYVDPVDVAVGPSGDIYVADLGRRDADGDWHPRIDQYDPSGSFIRAWGTKGTGPGEFTHISSITTDVAGNVYATDFHPGEDHPDVRVQKFSADGTYLTQFGTYGFGDGQWANDGIRLATIGSSVYLLGDDYNATGAVQRFVIAAEDEDVSEAVPAGGTVSTNTDGTPPTATDPLDTSVTVPSGGTVTIHETAASSTATGFVLLGEEVVIDAPAQTITDPMTIVFTVAKGLFADADPLTTQVFRDGVALGGCTGDPFTSTEDACVVSKVLTANGDLQLTIRTVHASRWGFAVPILPFAGFTDHASPPNLNRARAGRAVQVRFSLDGDRGLDVVDPADVKVRKIRCGSGEAVSGSARAKASPVTYDSGTGLYTMAWRTSSRWKGSCRELDIVLRDGSDHKLWFRLK
jgi:hypothetical protein